MTSRFQPKPYLLCALALSACGKLEQPREGAYRAVIELPGGELPFRLEIGNEAGHTQLWMLRETGKQAAAQVAVQNGQLSAELPDGAGKLLVSIRRKDLDGELELGSQKLKLRAERNATHRFFKDSATDNADVSGRWRLECKGDVHLELMQSHDQVDGIAQVAGAEMIVEGQVHRDDVSLGALGAGLVLLYKAQVDNKGNLEGELSDGMQARRCVALREQQIAPVE